MSYFLIVACDGDKSNRVFVAYKFIHPDLVDRPRAYKLIASLLHNFDAFTYLDCAENADTPSDAILQERNQFYFNDVEFICLGTASVQFSCQVHEARVGAIERPRAFLLEDQQTSYSLWMKILN